MDGSIPAEVTWELMRENRLNPVDTLDEMRRRLEIQEGEEGTLLAYLDKMHYPLWITQFYENIGRVTESIVLAAAPSGSMTLELRYSPVIHTYAGLTPRQSIRAALSGMNKAQKRPAMKLGLIVIAMRQHGPHIAKILARQALAEAQHLHERTGRRGLRHRRPRARQPAASLHERLRDRAPRAAGPHRPRRRGRARRLRLAGGRRAGRERIGHGCSAARDPELLKRLARDRIAVECCLSSNYHTGAVKRGTPPPDPRLPGSGGAGRPVLRQQHRLPHEPGAGIASRGGAGRADAVEAVHRDAEAHSFIRPETALPQVLAKLDPAVSLASPAIESDT